MAATIVRYESFIAEDGLPSIRSVAVTQADYERLVTALRRARVDMEGWGGYASEYFQEKWGLADDLKAIDDVLEGC